LRSTDGGHQEAIDADGRRYVLTDGVMRLEES
jgi:hypothetical protein